MDSTNSIDPQYLQFLPSHLALRSHVKVSTHLLSAPTDPSQAMIFYLNCINNPPSDKYRITDYADEDLKMWLMTRHLRPGLTFVDRQRLMIRHKSLQALQKIGLDYRGGVKKFMFAPLEKTNGELKLPTAGLLVTDADKAAKYIDLGTRFSPFDLQKAKSLDEAAKRFSDISTIVNPQWDVPAALETLGVDLERTTDEDEKWMLKREIFRLHVLVQHEEWLLDLANETQLCRQQAMQMKEKQAQTSRPTLVERKQAFKDALVRKRDSWETMEPKNMQGFEEHMCKEEWRYSRDSDKFKQLASTRAQSSVNLFLAKREGSRTPQDFDEDDDSDEESCIDSIKYGVEDIASEDHSILTATFDDEDSLEDQTESNSVSEWTTSPKMDVVAQKALQAMPDFIDLSEPAQEDADSSPGWIRLTCEPEEANEYRNFLGQRWRPPHSCRQRHSFGNEWVREDGADTEAKDCVRTETEDAGEEEWWTLEEWSDDVREAEGGDYDRLVPMFWRASVEKGDECGESVAVGDGWP